MSGSETIFSKDGGLGRVRLNRPKVLNALSAAQYHALTETLTTWEDDDSVALVLVEGEGERAFCAGGDIRMVWEAQARGDHDFNRQIFRTEYRLNRRIHHYPKPYIAILDGIVMGGGAGISINGKWRIATERTQFAMPETGIGFFPDVGATSFLGRCPGALGLYLGLTGARLGPADCVAAGLATHFVPQAELDAMTAKFLVAAASSDSGGAAEDVLRRFHRDPGPGPMALRAAEVDRCFGRGTLGDILAALRSEKSDWAWDTVEDLSSRSPTSLAVTFRQLTEGRGLAFDDAIRREFRLACRFLAGRDLFEGIRAQVIHKDRRPNWSPASLSEVDEIAVDGYFASLGGDELPLP
ncbi:enoyl-CoA hydratase/isomerase family protein [Paramagnetospirillum kuznetsovii]|uniref:3-hydroxyisobutyryl-CoA hydrolase n=1 Tax=Paramagnetospirillum kuznetsovii TaxID=2053833 RepID=A0A364P060_9PROT|nr:enoyl-CoA hydratase/isomerase family protein [Paramagnetospirillum kuznetsovii]RAU22505.1 enoyl-CoA hydratase/isomerase family protein [Paramagnetospirillum kuznetsovii]